MTGFVLSPEFYCEKVAMVCESEEFKFLDPNDYVRALLADKPDHIQSDNYLNNLYEQINSDPNPRKTIKIAHFTDLHVDLEYAVGAAINCENILCCRAVEGFPVDPRNQATEYGNYFCDVPPNLFYMMGDYIKQEINPDVIFWTGDTPPHDNWNYSLETTQMYTKFLSDYF